MLSNFTPLFCTILTALFPSFCYASFSLWFTAGPQGRGACLLTLSPEGAGKKLAITMSKYVHAKSPPAEGNCGLFVGVCGAGWGVGGRAVIKWAPLLQLIYLFYMC